MLSLFHRQAVGNGRSRIAFLWAVLLLALLVAGISGCGSEAQTEGSQVGGGGGGGGSGGAGDSGGDGGEDGGSIGGGGGEIEPPAPAVFAVVSVRNGQSVHSGFISGTAPEGAQSVEVALDGGEFSVAEGTTVWRFKLPTGAATWRHGSSHTVAARFTDAESIVSDPVTLGVRKGTNRDIDGDGFADLMVGAPNYDADGRAYIFLAGDVWTSGSTSNTAASSGVQHNSDNRGLGGAMALGDANGDGYADVVVSDDLAVETGRVYLFYSQAATGGPLPYYVAFADAMIVGESNGTFGSWVTLGDVDGDGFDDLIASTSDGAADRGLHVFLAHGTGITASDAAADADTFISGPTYAVLADVNGDGIQDVVGGYPNPSGNIGLVYVFYGVSGGPAAASTDDADLTIAGSSGFGQSIATGDFDQDGYVDLAVGDSYLERVLVFSSRLSGGSPDPYLTSASSADVTISNPVESGLGGNVTVGDVNGDGVDDLAAGTGHASYTLEERVYLFYGATGTGIAATSTNQANTRLSGDGGRFGHSIAILDANRDGFGDIAVGSWIYNSYQGRMHLFASAGAAGIPHSATVPPTAVVTGEYSGNKFGWSMSNH